MCWDDSCLMRIITGFVQGIGIVLITSVLCMAGVPAKTSRPHVISSVGYINGSALITHTANALNSTTASTLVAFVSTNSPWSGLPVTISSMDDNLGNHWSLLSRPGVFLGGTFNLVSALYFVNNPRTSKRHAIAVHLSNPAPLVFHVFAVSDSNTSGPPVSSLITDSGANVTSANVRTPEITVPNNSLLLSWAKNETGAKATAGDKFALDPRSTDFLWAESRSVSGAGAYRGTFKYEADVGWQAAIVAIELPTVPLALNQEIMTDEDKSVNIDLKVTATEGSQLTYSVLAGPAHGSISGSPPSLTYTPETGYVGTDTLKFCGNDGTITSNTAEVGITVRGLSPAVVNTLGYFDGTLKTAHLSKPFNSSGASTMVAFVSTHPAWNGLPISITGVGDNVGNNWQLLSGPTQFVGSSLTMMSAVYYVSDPATTLTHIVSVRLSNPGPLVFHIFAISGSEPGGAPIVSEITDPGHRGASTTVSTEPITVPGNSLLLGWVKNESSATASALNGYTLDSHSSSFLWAEILMPISAGSYAGKFRYDSAIGWQAAVVGIPPLSSAARPAVNPSN